ncbi:hypothetical protein CTAYLR_008070 [Chrysophaeum taylorii]|uniref:Sodium/calcium exchanger membrane region domain-containing protein n=1 Tax=Chrysophaeum taylorii TaxID=2483200 RepID=A0AAD7UK41_9STRA|nr:hypothetical protein CTAYLR_008070 [Chrysophaeum taylorii]
MTDEALSDDSRRRRRVAGIALGVALATYAWIEFRDVASLEAASDAPYQKFLRRSAERYIRSHASRYRLGHYLRSQSLLKNLRRVRVEKKKAIEAERERAARELYGWMAWRAMGPVWLGLLLLLTAWMGLMLEERTLPALKALCAAARVSDDVAGATVLALATGGFEVLFSAVETLGGEVGVGLNFVLGSGIVNFGLILPIVVFASPHRVDLDLRPVLRDGGFALLSFATLLVVVADGQISRLESVTLLGLYGCHVAACVAPPRLCRARPLDREPDEHPPELPKLHVVDDDDTWAARVRDASHALLPPSPGIIARPDHKKLSSRRSALGATCVAVAPTLVVSGVWFVLLLVALTKLADLLALSARVPLGLAASVFLPAVYAVPDLLVAATVSKKGQAKAAVANALGVQVVTVLLGVGVPFALATLRRGSGPVRLLGSESDASLRWSVFALGALFFALVLGPMLLGAGKLATSPQSATNPAALSAAATVSAGPHFSRRAAVVLLVAYLAVTLVVSLRTA